MNDNFGDNEPIDDIDVNDDVGPEDVESDEDEYMDDEDQLQRHRAKKRKLVTRKRPVHSIDTSLDEANYNAMVYVNKEVSKNDLIGYPGPKGKPSTEKIVWGNEPPPEGGRQRSCDVIIRDVGIVPNSSLQRCNWPLCVWCHHELITFQVFTKSYNI